MARRRAGLSFLTRLGRDVRGNTIALVAAAMLPLAGLIGGGVDMSRLYLTKTRLQQACDAGALAGRKAMGTGTWGTGTEDKANELFTANFVEGNYGTGTLSKRFWNDDGVINGTATVAVPMTIMRVFGMMTRSLTVSCTAKMEIPNTDVMFVLDVTNSMSGSRITGLKSAVKCFYEALVKVATPQVCDAAHPANDPTATAYTGTAQIRLGFVPYAVNANVGKLLPNSLLADSWNYQTREATLGPTVQTWKLETETGISGWGSWPAAPTNLTSASTYSGWTNIGNSGSTTVNNIPYTNAPTGKNSTSCPAIITKPGQLEYVDTGNVRSASLQGTTNDPPVYPASQQVLSYSQNDDHSVTAYKYTWTGSTSSCRLQRSSAHTYTLTRTGGRSTKDITWTAYSNVIQSWTYKQMSLSQIAALKAGDSNWNGSITLPVGQTNSPSVKRSGSNSSETLKLQTDVAVTWDGCLEEPTTFQNSDGDPSDDWDPVSTTALDMNLDDTTPGRWGPMLPGAIWARYSGSSRSFNAITTTNDLSQSTYMKYYCPTPSRKLAEYRTSADLVSYIDSLTVPSLGTYHDSGMIWGARLISPTGIFASENAQTTNGGAIQRHLIFMTDGNAQTVHDNYTSFGLSFYDRRQTNYDPSEGQTDSLTNARLLALCKKVKDMNITLWVISYGGGVDDDNEERLTTCATPGHYYSADDGPALMDRFKKIAAEISELRLTS